MTTKGVLPPRILICALLLIPPPDVLTIRPGARPAKPFDMFVIGSVAKSSDFTDETEAIMERFVVVP